MRFSNSDGRIRVPLALVVGRYFVLVLFAALLTVGGPWALFTGAMARGEVLPADWGSTAPRRPSLLRLPPVRRPPAPAPTSRPARTRGWRP